MILELEWDIENRRIKDLIDYHKNPRTITKNQFESLKNNIKKFGLIDRPFINTDNTIIGGHQRIRLLKKLGYDEIEVQVPNRLLTEREVEELNYRHNENGGSWDYDILYNQYTHLDLIAWGQDPLEAETIEEKTKKPRKPKVIFEFENQQDLDEHSELIEEAAFSWNAKVKVKV